MCHLESKTRIPTKICASLSFLFQVKTTVKEILSEEFHISRILSLEPRYTFRPNNLVKWLKLIYIVQSRTTPSKVFYKGTFKHKINTKYENKCKFLGSFAVIYRNLWAQNVSLLTFDWKQTGKTNITLSNF